MTKMGLVGAIGELPQVRAIVGGWKGVKPPRVKPKGLADMYKSRSCCWRSCCEAQSDRVFLPVGMYRVHYPFFMVKVFQTLATQKLIDYKGQFAPSPPPPPNPQTFSNWCFALADR